VSEDPYRERLIELALTLPEAKLPARESAHLKFEVRGKTFAYYLVNHHGDGRLALATKCPPGEHQALTAAEPERFFIPAYIGPRGWVGLDRDAAPVNWDEVAGLLATSYRLVAPKRLATMV
jgi:hypothetical protein